MGEWREERLWRGTELDLTISELCIPRNLLNNQLLYKMIIKHSKS